MSFYSFLVNTFALLALLSAIMVIASKNPIHSVVFLILVFCNATGLLLLLKLEFIAIMFLIIYVGAIAVLFLFVVMMLNIKLNQLNENWVRYLPIGGIISLIFLLEIFLVVRNDLTLLSSPLLPTSSFIFDFSLLFSHLYSSQKPWTSLVVAMTNIQSLGFLIYTYYAYYFILASLILLVAMIGSIVLTMYKRKHSFKKQLIFKQIARNFSTSIGHTYH